MNISRMITKDALFLCDACASCAAECLPLTKLYRRCWRCLNLKRLLVLFYDRNGGADRAKTALSVAILAAVGCIGDSAYYFSSPNGPKFGLMISEYFGILTRDLMHSVVNLRLVVEGLQGCRTASKYRSSLTRRHNAPRFPVQETSQHTPTT